MKELTIEEKIAEIKNTTSYQDVKNAWFPPYYEKEYYFVSYSHKDYKLVYESLHRLQSGEKRLSLWYDHNLAPGRDWEIEARRYIYDFNCKGVIFFLSENAVLSRSIHKEIEFVKESGKEYLSINLPCEKIEGHIGEYLSAVKMLELLKQQGYPIENYEEKAAVLGKTFNDNVIYLSFNEDIDTQKEKILSLKRQPLLEFDKDWSTVVSINNLYAEAIQAADFKYLNEKNEYVFAEEIRNCAFANCRWLKKIEVSDSIMWIGDFAFYGCTCLESISMPSDIISIGKNVFYGCTSLECITIPDKVVSIGDRAFTDCSNLKCIILPDSVTSIGRSAFSDCTSLENITIPDKITSIGEEVFSQCTSLKSIVLPDKLTSIGDGAFSGCTSLENITLPNKITSIGRSAFSDCISLENITLPNKITSIGDGAFSNCTSLENIILPNKITSIAEGVFRGCGSLENIILPDKITSIGDSAFSGCTSLENISLPDKITSIGRSAFSCCSSLKSIALPDRLTSIGGCAFFWCSRLKSLTIPNSATLIDERAFFGCRGLKDIFYKGTKLQWKSIDKRHGWDDDTLDYIIHCADGDLKKGESID